MGVGSRQIGPRMFFACKLGPGKSSPWKMLVRQIGHQRIGPWQIVPWQIGPLENIGVANWAPANWAPGKSGPGKSGPSFCQQNVTINLLMIFNVQCTNTKIQMHKYNNTQIQLIIIFPIQIYTLGNIFRLNLYIGIGYILQTIKNICKM